MTLTSDDSPRCEVGSSGKTFVKYFARAFPYSDDRRHDSRLLHAVLRNQQTLGLKTADLLVQKIQLIRSFREYWVVGS